MLLKTAYPEFHKDTKDIEPLVNLWYEMLSQYTVEQCMIALQSVIAESPYPPKISDIIIRIKPQKALNQGVDIHTRKMLEWYENHKADLHSRGLKTAVEFKNEGKSYLDYFAQFEV